MDVTFTDVQNIIIGLVIVARVAVKIIPGTDDDNFLNNKILPVLRWLGLIVGEKNRPLEKENKK